MKSFGDVTATKPAAPLPPPWFQRDWVLGLVLVLAVILAYSPVWWAGYVWDDDAVVTGNPAMMGPLGLKKIWTTNAADICPFTLTTFWIEHTLWGLAPLPFHLVNVCLHGGCAVLLWRVLLSMRVPGAWLGAALWALHPVQVESVAWVTEMKNLESGLFFLLSILFFVRWLRARNPHGKTGTDWNYALTLLFAALAMASKSSTVILPVVLCLCAWWMEGRWNWRTLAKVFPVLLLSAAAAAVSMWTQGLQLANFRDPQGARSWPERLATAGDAVWFYQGKLLWPHPLMAIYPRWKIDINQWVSYLPLLAIFIVLLVLWFGRKSWARPWFCVFAYFIAALLPVLGLVDMYVLQFSPVFDHFQYLAGMGPLALAGAGMARLADYAIPEKFWLHASLGAGLLLMLGIVSWQRTWVYESQETLWTDTLAKNPNSSVAYNNLGYALSEKGRMDEATVQFQRALAINPSNAEAHYNFGVVLFRKGLLDEAMAQFQMALGINPSYADAHYNLGDALLQKGRADEAVAQFRAALKIDPDYARARNNLGWALLQKEQVDEAIVQFQKALEIDPNNAKAHNDLGIAYFKKGQMNEAMAQFQEALRLQPGYADAQNNLANMQAMARQAHSSK